MASIEELIATNATAIVELATLLEHSAEEIALSSSGKQYTSNLRWTFQFCLCSPTPR
jgi:hypothetical protein